MRQFRKSEILAMSTDERYALAKGELAIPRCGMMGDGEILSAVLARLAEGNLLIDDGEAATASGSGAATSAPAVAAAAGVTALYSPNELADRPELVGRSLAYLVAQLAAPWGIAPNARVYLDGVLVGELRDGEPPRAFEEIKLAAGARVEFSRPAAEKA